MTWTGSESASDVLISASTVCSAIVDGVGHSEQRGTYAERDAGEVLPAKCLDGGCGCGVLDEHGGGAREGGDESERFEALAETRSELVLGRGELGEQALL